MSPLDWVTKVMDFSQTSLDNTLDTIKEVHQTIAEIPINVAQELGMSEETSTALKNTHRRVLDHIHAGVSNAVAEVNQYMVKQAQNVNDLASFDPNTEEQAIMKLERKRDDSKEIKLN